MQKSYLLKTRPLTRLMEEQLMEFHEQELLHMEPAPAYYSRGCKGLLMRGYIRLRQINNGLNKSIYIFQITETGIRYLSSMGNAD